METVILNNAINAIRRGNQPSGEKLLKQAVRQDPTNEAAWLWLAHCQTDIRKKIDCLERAIYINPQNERVQAALDELYSQLNDLPYEEKPKGKSRPNFFTTNLLAPAQPFLNNTWLKAKKATRGMKSLAERISPPRSERLRRRAGVSPVHKTFNFAPPTSEPEPTPQPAEYAAMPSGYGMPPRQVGYAAAGAAAGRQSSFVCPVVSTSAYPENNPVPPRPLYPPDFQPKEKSGLAAIPGPLKWLLIGLGLVILVNVLLVGGALYYTYTRDQAAYSAPSGPVMASATPPAPPAAAAPSQAAKGAKAQPTPTKKAKKAKPTATPAKKGKAAKPAAQVAPTQVKGPYRPGSWEKLPVVPASVSSKMKKVYHAGINAKRDQMVFSKIGDKDSALPFFLGSFEDAGKYNLGPYTKLGEVIEIFSGRPGSFKRASMAVRPGMNSAAVLSPIWAETPPCQKQERPLDCEYRLNKSSIAFISLGNNEKDLAEFEKNLRSIVAITLKQNIVPILVTKAYDAEGGNRVNDIIGKVAYENEVPVWNFWAACQSLPYKGLDRNNNLIPGLNFYFNNPDELKNSWPVRNLTALQTLDSVWRSASGRK